MDGTLHREIRRQLPDEAASPGRFARPISPLVVAGLVKAADFAAIGLASLAAWGLYLYFYLGTAAEIDRCALIGGVGAAFTVGLVDARGGYAFRRLHDLLWQLRTAALAWGAVVALGLLTAFLLKSSGYYSRGWAISWVLLALGGLWAQRLVAWTLVRRWTAAGRLARKAVVVGANEAAAYIIGELRQQPSAFVHILGIFDDRLTRLPPALAGFPVLGTTRDLVAFARRERLDEIILALPLTAEARLREIIERLAPLPVDLRLSLGEAAERLAVRGVSHIGAAPLLDLSFKPLRHWDAVAKWLEDKLLGAALLLVLAPLMAAIALLVRLDSRGPSLFVQERFGFNNKPIRVFKFRTMYADRGDASGAAQTVRDDPRVTRIGRYLRAFSLDELPQLLNVLRGEMSLVGPRAHAITMKAAGRLYHDAVDEYFHRHRVKPGLTGWAQIHGLRGETDTMEKAQRRVDYDLWYIEHWSLWLDLRIILGSARVMVVRENAY